MLTMTVIAQIKPKKELEFRQAISSLYSNGGEEKGLKKSLLYQDVNDPQGFRVITEWQTRKDLDAHLLAPDFNVLLGALQVLCTKSEIRYSDIHVKPTGTQGSKP